MLQLSAPLLPRLFPKIAAFLVIIGLAAAARRAYVLIIPLQVPRFAAAVTTLFAVLFLLFLGLGFRDIRHGRVGRHREWMIRAFGVLLGIATTRPIVAAFSPPVASHLTNSSERRSGWALLSRFWLPR